MHSACPIVIRRRRPARHRLRPTWRPRRLRTHGPERVDRTATPKAGTLRDVTRDHQSTLGLLGCHQANQRFDAEGEGGRKVA